MTIPDLSINRKPYNPKVIDEVARGNLFRQDRTDYVPPPRPAPPPPQIVNKPTLPPPELRLKGVMLLNGIKIAILEGKYSVFEGANNVKQKDLKRKGYVLGDLISDYEITDIDKKVVTLDNNKGNIIQVRLLERPPSKVILRKGNLLFQKSRDFNPRKIKMAQPPQPVRKASPVRKPNPKPAAAKGAPPPYPYKEVHISGRTIYVPAPAQHVSGN